MISVNGYNITPTMFPDGTSQVWHLPDKLLDEPAFAIRWDFQSEREMFDLMSLNRLLGRKKVKRLSMPYLPYARQDKEVSNEKTFSFHVFANFIESMGFYSVNSVDVHNPELAAQLIKGFENRVPLHFHEWAIDRFRPKYLMFPDDGAVKRYSYLGEYPRLVGKKTRNSQGEIDGYGIEMPGLIENGARILIIDDICDGGATFLKAASILKMKAFEGELGLAVTHGLFSKGRDDLQKAGFRIFTTDTLLTNQKKDDVYKWI